MPNSTEFVRTGERVPNEPVAAREIVPKDPVASTELVTRGERLPTDAVGVTDVVPTDALGISETENAEDMDRVTEPDLLDVDDLEPVTDTDTDFV